MRSAVTQFEYVGAVEAISERFLVPVLEGLLDLFPFAILGFHADNGSEYVNHRVAALLAQLHAEFTKSRPRHSNDNALAESKNASVVRKWFGHDHIPQRFAPLVDRFARHTLSPALTRRHLGNLDKTAPAVSDLAAMRDVNRARDALFRAIGAAPDAAKVA